MHYPLLAIALLLPWLGGYFWLAAAENRWNRGPHNTAGQIGYGLFIGYGTLQGIVLACNSILGTATFLPIMLLLALFTLAGYGLFALSRAAARRANRVDSVAVAAGPAIEQVLFWLCVGGVVIHLVLVAIEILHRPVFPWDAWLNWMYRAKAWFYSGHLFTLDEPIEWLQGSGAARYNVDGSHYPTLVPVSALWAAMALGHWSETLVNLPTLCCGIALGLALYGQCRAFGLEKWLSALAAYLLLSIPLVDTHLSLAGQSDIWMAGFTGLGFVALLHGIIRDSWPRILLGLGMTAIGIATKLEGTVWFFAAVLTLLLARYTRTTVSLLIALAGIATLCWATGINFIDMPVLGRLGVAEGRLHIPLLGSFALQSFDLWDDYRENFLNNGTWHLLWLFVLLSAIGLKFLSPGILRRTLVAFYAVLLAVQVVIFHATEQGMWAEDWTAINRLPLHFAPPLVFSMLILVRAFRQRARIDSPEKNDLPVAVASLLIALAGAMAYLLASYPVDSQQPAKNFTARDMRIVVGGGRQAGDTGVIERYQNNIAILSSGPVQLDSSLLGLARLETAAASPHRADLFWRNGNGPDDLHSTELSAGGVRWVNLDDLPEWRGQVTEFGIIFYSEGGQPVEFHQLGIMPQTLPSQLAKLIQDWRQTSTWSQKSVHWLPAGAVAPTIPLPALVSAWVLTALLIAVITRRRSAAVCACVLVCAMAGWAVLDFRWIANSVAQAGETMSRYPLATASYLEFGDDDFTWQLVETARADIERRDARTIITAVDNTMRFNMFRAKYHALPAATLVHEGSPASIPAQIADYILVLKKRYSAPGDQLPSAADYARIINRQGTRTAATVWDAQQGFLLRLAPVTSPGARQ